MNIKKLFGVLFIILMLLSVPCVYATDGSLENNEINKAIGDTHLNPVITDAIKLSADIITVSANPIHIRLRQPTIESPQLIVLKDIKIIGEIGTSKTLIELDEIRDEDVLAKARDELRTTQAE